MGFKNKFSSILAVIVIALIIWGYLPTRNDKHTNLDGPFAVTHIVDGDTIYVLDGNEKLKIRLIGINTPEKDMPYYKEATDYTASLVKNKNVYLAYDAERYDKYGRTLAYVYLEDKTTMLNYEIINAGWAKVLTIAPNDSYADKFEQGYQNAKKQSIGIHQKH